MYLWAPYAFINYKKQRLMRSFSLYKINMQTTIKLTTLQYLNICNVLTKTFWCIFLEFFFRILHTYYIDKTVYAAEEKTLSDPAACLGACYTSNSIVLFCLKTLRCRWNDLVEINIYSNLNSSIIIYLVLEQFFG